MGWALVPPGVGLIPYRLAIKQKMFGSLLHLSVPAFRFGTAVLSENIPGLITREEFDQHTTELNKSSLEWKEKGPFKETILFDPLHEKWISVIHQETNNSKMIITRYLQRTQQVYYLKLLVTVSLILFGSPVTWTALMKAREEEVTKYN